MILGRILVAAALLGGAGTASGQSLTVLPVSIAMAPGQSATTLTIINAGTTESSVQIRGFEWSQPAGDDVLTPTNQILVSPPIATIPARTAQVVRLVLRAPPAGKEATYRIIVDQIPPPAEPGTVRIALRLSIPVFAQPKTRALPHLVYRIESGANAASLVVINDGNRHETLRTITLTDGLTASRNVSPYVLAGTTRRWPLTIAGSVPAAGTTARLTAGGDTGALDQPVPVVGMP